MEYFSSKVIEMHLLAEYEYFKSIKVHSLWMAKNVLAFLHTAFALWNYLISFLKLS